MYRLSKVTHIRNSDMKVYLFVGNDRQLRVFDNVFGGQLYAGFDYEIEVKKRGSRLYLINYQPIYQWNYETLPEIVNFLFANRRKAEEFYKEQDNHSLKAFIEEAEKNKEVNVDAVSKEFEEIGTEISMFFEESRNQLSLGEVAYLTKARVPRGYIEKGIDDGLTVNEIINSFYDISLLSTTEYSVTYKGTDRAARNLGLNLLSNERMKAAALQAFIEGGERDGHVFLRQRDFNRYAASVYNFHKTKKAMNEWLEETGGRTSYIKIGNSFLPLNMSRLYKELKNPYKNVFLFNVNFKMLHYYLEKLIEEGYVVHEKKSGYNNDVYYINTERHPYYDIEDYIAKELVRHKVSKVPHYDEEGNVREITREEVSEILTEFGYELEDKQFEFVYRNVKENGGIGYLNGGAGRGKTFTVSAYIQVYKKINKDVTFLLLAPTGRAAKQLEESTGIPASTLHHFIYTANNPGKDNKVDVYIIDETSMVDMKLFYRFIRLTSPFSKIIVVGHDRQLESIDAGRIFADIIYSHTFDGVTLDVAKRFKSDSKIFENAERILSHQDLIPYNDEKENEVIYTHSDEEMLEVILKKLRERYNDDIGFKNTQVLVPLYRGIVGIDYLNYRIKKDIVGLSLESSKYIKRSSFRQTINGVQKEYDIVFNEGDKVLNLENVKKNRYSVKTINDDEKEVSLLGDKGTVMNGDIGYVVYIGYVEIDINENMEHMDDYEEEIKEVYGLVVKMDDGYFFYPATEVRKYLNLAYAMSVHKSQGSEWHSTYLLISDNHRISHQNNVVYTGFTRSKKYQCTIGSKTAIRNAIMNETKDKRNTQLIERIQYYDHHSKSIKEELLRDFDFELADEKRNVNRLKRKEKMTEPSQQTVKNNSSASSLTKEEKEERKKLLQRAKEKEKTIVGSLAILENNKKESKKEKKKKKEDVKSSTQDNEQMPLDTDKKNNAADELDTSNNSVLAQLKKKVKSSEKNNKQPKSIQGELHLTSKTNSLSSKPLTKKIDKENVFSFLKL